MKNRDFTHDGIFCAIEETRLDVAEANFACDALRRSDRIDGDNQLRRLLPLALPANRRVRIPIRYALGLAPRP